MRVWLRRLGPWVITAVIVVWLLRTYHFSDIVANLRSGHWLAALPFGFGLPFAYLLVVVLWDWIVLRATVPRPPTYWETFGGKAAASLLLVIGYFVSSGGYGLWIARKTRASAVRSAGTVLYLMMSDLVSICLVASCAMAMGHPQAPRWLFGVLVGIAVVQILLILLAPLELFGRTPEIFRPWQDVPRSAALLQILGRCANVLVAVLLTWAGTRAFGMHIPFHAMAIFGPVILLVASLPISVAGFGVSQTIWFVLAPWASHPQLLAFQFVWNLMLGTATVLRALPFVRRAILDIDTGVSEVKSPAVGGLG
jgi:hypothetical protein